VKEADATEGFFCPLNELAVGDYARVVEILGDKKMTRRLMSLGLKTGSEITVLHRRGQGVVVGSGGNRIAIGEGVANCVIMRFLQHSATDEEHG
jgi:ferrous iron transport protein A